MAFGEFNYSSTLKFMHKYAYISTDTSSPVTLSPTLTRLNENGHCIVFWLQDLVRDDPGVVLRSRITLEFLSAFKKRVVEL